MWFTSPNVWFTKHWGQRQERKHLYEFLKNPLGIQEKRDLERHWWPSWRVLLRSTSLKMGRPATYCTQTHTGTRGKEYEHTITWSQLPQPWFFVLKHLWQYIAGWNKIRCDSKNTQPEFMSWPLRKKKKKRRMSYYMIIYILKGIWDSLD